MRQISTKTKSSVLYLIPFSFNNYLIIVFYGFSLFIFNKGQVDIKSFCNSFYVNTWLYLSYIYAGWNTYPKIELYRWTTFFLFVWSSLSFENIHSKMWVHWTVWRLNRFPYFNELHNLTSKMVYFEKSELSTLKGFIKGV